MPRNEDAGRDLLGMHRAFTCSSAVVRQFCALLASVVPGLASAGSFRELLDENMSDQVFFLSTSKEVVSLVAMATCAQRE